MVNNEKARFPGYARKKISWTIDNFSPEILKNDRFYSVGSPNFSIQLYKGLGWCYATTNWKLSLYRRLSSVSLYLSRVDSPGFNNYKDHTSLSVSFECGVVNFNTDVTNTSRGKLDSISYSERLGKLFNYKELNSHKYAILKNTNSLTIVASLEFVENVKHPVIHNAMSTDYEKLFNNKKFSDFTLITSEGNEIPVHKTILSTRSPVFETMMETKMRESKEGKATIDDISDKALLEFLRFVYCGRVEGDISEIAIDLLYAASKYDIGDLKPLCVESLTRNLTQENVLETLALAELHGEKELADYCIDFVKWHYSELKKSEGWKVIPGKLYKDILDRTMSINHSDSEIKVASKITITPVTIPLYNASNNPPNAAHH